MMNSNHAKALRIPTLTVEGAAYGVIGLVAALIRFAQLGLRPLSDVEAVQALAAFRFTEGTLRSAPPGTLPALFTGNVVGFTLFGSGDAVARWLPAVAGVVLVFLPYLLRHRLGRGGSLAASFLLAISPTAVFGSRSADGVGLAATCGLALAACLIRFVDSRQPAWIYAGAAVLGLGLTTSPIFFHFLASLALFGLLLFALDRFGGRSRGWTSLVVATTAVQEDSPLLVQGAAILMASFGLSATTFVLHPAGIGHVADLLGAWVQSFGAELKGNPVVYPLLLLLRYELPSVLLSLVALVWLAARDRNPDASTEYVGSTFPLIAFLTFWAVTMLGLVLVAGHRPAGYTLFVVMPLALLGGWGVSQVASWFAEGVRWRDVTLLAGTALALLVFFYLQVGAYAAASEATTVSVAGITLYARASYLILALVGCLLLIVLAVGVWTWRGADTALGSGWLVLVMVLILGGVQMMWRVNFAQASDPRELMLLTATDPDVRNLVDAIEDLSLQSAGARDNLAFTTDAATGPVVAWYLRHFGEQIVVQDLGTPPETVAAVTLAAQDLPIGESFRGQGFSLRSHWLPWGVWGQDLVRWWLFSEGSQPVLDEEVVLWVASPQ